MSGRNDLDRVLPGLRGHAPAAFAAVYDATADGLHSFALSILRDRSAAEDAVQQTFLELVRAAPRLKGDGRSVTAWLYRSVRFNCLDEVRRRSRHPETPVATLPDVGADDPDPPGSLDPELEAALTELTAQQRAVLFLRHVVGLSGQETAQVLGTNRGSVFAVAARAERRLRRLLSKGESP